MHHSTRLTCHCEERSDVAISGRHLQFVQGVDKTHGPIASVAALSERHAGCRFGGTPPTAPALVGERTAGPGDALAARTGRR